MIMYIIRPHVNKTNIDQHYLIVIRFFVFSETSKRYCGTVKASVFFLERNKYTQ